LESKNSNIFSIYQISAEDVGCKIIVEVSPIDLDDVYDGTAVAEFGPVDIEPNAKQSLEYIIGSGGTWFPVHIYYVEDRHLMKDERQCWDGTLVVNTWTIKLIENNPDAQGGKKTLFYLKYTIDHPALDISSNDTKMISLHFSEIENQFFD